MRVGDTSLFRGGESLTGGVPRSFQALPYQDVVQVQRSMLIVFRQFGAVPVPWSGQACLANRGKRRDHERRQIQQQAPTDDIVCQRTAHEVIVLVEGTTVNRNRTVSE